jgi:DNA-binding transcriptional MerR regulator
MAKTPVPIWRMAEFARHAGVTVRALRHYDRLGLLKPRRTPAGYRIYTEGDLATLEQIVALKFIGIPLRQIASVRRNTPGPLADVLQRQRRALEGKRRLLSIAIDLVAEAERLLRAGDPNGASIYRRIIEAIEMQHNGDEWLHRYKDLVEKKRVRLLSMSQDERDQMRQQWLDLFADVRTALDDDPTGPRGQALVARWLELGRRMSDATDEELAKHFTVKPDTLDVVKELRKDLSDAELARLKSARAQFSDPQVRDWLRKALAASRA